MVRPIVPIIEYYANYDYIATVLCENRDKPYLECNGKCYLQKQLNKVNENQNHNHKSTIPQIDLEKYPVSPIEEIAEKKEFKTTYFDKNQIAYVQFSSQEYFKFVFKPPRFSA